MTEQEIRRALDGLVQRLRDRHWQECDCDLEGEEKTCKSQSLRDANAVAATLRALLEARELLGRALTEQGWEAEARAFLAEEQK